jgi:hypothetical protein
MVLTAYSALSPVTGLSCHRRRRNRFRRLDTSVGVSGPHDFAVRARLSHKLRDGPGTGPPQLCAKAVQRHSSFDTAASTASRSNVRDDRDTPLKRDGMAGNIFLIWGVGQLRRAAARWHDGQITRGRGEERVKGMSSFRGIGGSINRVRWTELGATWAPSQFENGAPDTRACAPTETRILVK